MNGILICAAGYTPAMRYTCAFLQARGIQIIEKPTKDVTHLLLPVPAFEPDGRIRGGGILEHILHDLPDHVTVVGGGLNHPALHTYEKIDLLGQPDFVARNAAITAECALQVAAGALPTVFEGQQILILGWGRIGKCLAQKLHALGAKVTVAARKPADRAMLRALGYGAEDIAALGGQLCRYRLIFNTVPYPVLNEAQAVLCEPDCVKIELASKSGIAGADVLQALGLPGRMAPETAGNLIAATLIRCLMEKGADK